MYNPTSEPGYGENKRGFPQPRQPQGPYPYRQPGMGHNPPPMQQQPTYPPPMQEPMPQQPIHRHNTNTTVVIQQQPTQLVVPGPRDWSTGLCACFDDCGVCLLGWLCPCILQCMVSGNAQECCCVAACYPVALRTKIRIRHNIAGSIWEDACILGSCGTCALCQMARELKIHGI